MKRSESWRLFLFLGGRTPTPLCTLDPSRGQDPPGPCPRINHFWATALYVNARGLTSSQIPCSDGAFEITFDFIAHTARNSGPVAANPGLSR